MSEWVWESPNRVSRSNLSYPMFAVKWPRGHVNTRVNKSMTTVSVIEDISDIVSISRGFMEYPFPFTCYDVIACILYPRTPNLSQPLYSYMCISKSHYINHLCNIKEHALMSVSDLLSISYRYQFSIVSNFIFMSIPSIYYFIFNGVWIPLIIWRFLRISNPMFDISFKLEFNRYISIRHHVHDIDDIHLMGCLSHQGFG